jgi:hypothetical protein
MDNVSFRNRGDDESVRLFHKSVPLAYPEEENICCYTEES